MHKLVFPWLRALLGDWVSSKSGWFFVVFTFVSAWNPDWFGRPPKENRASATDHYFKITILKEIRSSSPSNTEGSLVVCDMASKVVARADPASRYCADGWETYLEPLSVFTWA